MNENFAHERNAKSGAGISNLLIVDDDRDITISLKAMIEVESEKFVIQIANSMEKVEKITESFSPDVVLLDIRLGRRNGLNLIPKLREKFGDVVFIIMTAYREFDYAVKAVRYSADEFLYKPINPENLLHKLDGLINRQALIREKKNTENRFRAVFEQTFQMLFLLDMNGVLIEVNGTALNMIGKSSNQVLGKKIWETDWWNADDGDKHRLESLVEVAASGDSCQDEFRLLDGTNVEQIWDFSIKPVSHAEENNQFILLEGRDVTFRKRLEQKLEQKANHDALTGLPNRALYKEQTEAALSQGARHNRKLAVMFLDIDHFKKINDSYGHQVGDSVLIDIAGRIKACLREEDIASRYSGDEFTITLCEIESIDAVKGVAQRIVNSLSRPSSQEGNEVLATVSIGIAIYPDHGKDVAQLVNSADSAMYLAKSSGKNQYKIFKPS